MLGRMARDDDDDSPWTRQLLVGVGALVVVALVIGGVISVVALGAANVAGLDESRGRPRRRSRASTSPPASRPRGRRTTRTRRAGTTRPRARTPARRRSRPAEEAPADQPAGFPDRVGANERINLTGTFQRGREGAQLRVQRLESGTWSDFPVTATVSGGQFSTYVTTSRSGPQRFRVTDLGSGRSSNPVRVTVG